MCIMIFFKKKKQEDMKQEDMSVARPNKIKSSQPLTLTELDQHIKERISTIQNEFTDGFNFIKKCEKSVSFFGSARTLENEQDYINAMNLASRISTLGYAIITGGGPGIMEAANRGASENKGLSIGFTIKLPSEQVTNPYINQTLNFKYFFTRKVALTYAAEAYIYFPGGFGTMDELFEILTLVQTNKIEQVPIVLFGSYFWNPLKDFIIHFLVKNGKIDQSDMKLFIITDSIDEAVNIVKNAPIREAH